MSTIITNLLLAAVVAVGCYYIDEVRGLRVEISATNAMLESLTNITNEKILKLQEEDLALNGSMGAIQDHVSSIDELLARKKK